ncbi:MAG: small ribosomal subunit biogenesis GTPase RsgA [Hahellaceae bacterium]|nr:small ribosomal subunit biogenesis GTPase RsgA [Hahellaceae bacterium]
MAKRNLTRQQKWRIQKKQEAYLIRAEKSALKASSLEDGELSSEQEGLIIAHYGQTLQVESLADETKGQGFRCYARTNLGPLVTGDKVIWRAGKDQDGVVIAIQPRSSLLSRPDKFRALKPVAANIDVIGIVIASQPEPHPNLIDRYLVAAELSGIQPALILNKTDLLAPDSEVPALIAFYEALGYPCIRVSASSGTQMGALRTFLVGKTSVLVGQSGVGKSSLIQALLPEETLKVGGLSEAVAKGTHTTTTAYLYHLPEGGDLVDSPGIREFGLWHIEEKELIDGFKELRRYDGHCRFRDCKHFQDPGCALTRAVEAGEVSPARRDSYLLIRDTLDEVDILI